MWKSKISKRDDDSCRKNGIRRLLYSYPSIFCIRNDITKKQLINLKEAHFKRIELSDAILVVNINNYIGESPNLEIDYAKKLGKDIIYYTNLIGNN